MSKCCKKFAASMFLLCILTNAQTAHGASVSDYDSVQAAIDANPGGVIDLGTGVHAIDRKLHINKDNTVLVGYATIVSSNPDEPIVEVEHAEDVRIVNLTLTRTEDTQDCQSNGIFVYDAERVTLEGVRVLENRSRSAAIELRETINCTVSNSEVRNYKCIAIDDRMDSPLHGYAFRAIDGTGVMVRDSRGARITDNRILEYRYTATRENKKDFDLGVVVQKADKKLELMPDSVWKEDRVQNWHQGSGIVITSPETTSHVLVAGNSLENVAQGFDIHADHVICTDNIIDHAMIGIKATHGAVNLMISNNHISHVDLWGILLNPGASSHDGRPETEGGPRRKPNVDGGTIVSANIITEYGEGNEFWNWGGSDAIRIADGQLAENPPLRDVIFDSNIVYNSRRDEGRPARYNFAVAIQSWSSGESANMPRNIRFTNNIFHPGKEGVSNVPLEQFSE